MKTKIILILFGLLCALNYGSAQNSYWNYVVDDGNQTKLKSVITTMDNGLIIGTDRIIEECWTFNNVTKLDSLGQEVWTLKFENWDDTEGIMTNKALLELPNGDVVITGDLWANGDLDFSNPIRFYVVSPDGLVKVRSILTPDVSASFDTYTNPVSCALIDSTEVLVSVYDSLFRVTTSGSVVNSLDFSASEAIQSIQVLDENTWFLQTDNALFLTDSLATVIDSFSTNSTVEDWDVVNGQIKVITDGVLYTLDSNLNIISSMDDFDDDFYPSISSGNDVHWLKKYNENTQVFDIVEIDNATEMILNSFTVPIDLLELDANIVVGNKSFYLLSEREQQVSISTFDINNFDYNPVFEDVEIVDIELDSVRFSIYDGTQGAYHVYAEVTIQNKGIDSLNSFSLFYDSNGYGGFDCGNSDKYIQVENEIPIASNETITIPFYGIGPFDPALGSTLYDIELCLSCKAPNQRIETIIDNNFFCKDFSVTSLANISKNSNYHLYPNPTKDIINLETDITKGKIQVFDVNGTLILEKEINSDKQAIDMSVLNTGIYIVKIIGQEQQYVGKVVKE